MARDPEKGIYVVVRKGYGPDRILGWHATRREAEHDRQRWERLARLETKEGRRFAHGTPEFVVEFRSPHGPRAPSRDPSKARKYYVVDQAQGGLWQQIGRFYARAEAERFRANVPGHTRIVHTYPAGHNAPVAPDPRRRARARRKGRS